ncbi:hypothetical protein MMC30_001571 [Trapelia coarctata]|nr:hypothetical protein [Trapelia coarctata]
MEDYNMEECPDCEAVREKMEVEQGKMKVEEKEETAEVDGVEKMMGALRVSEGK